MDQRHPHYFLTKGSQVEVSSDEDGFNGAWFVATVIHPPPSISTTKKTKSLNHHTNNNLVYVEYHNLISEDGSSRRLREYANVSYVRPSPNPDPNAAAPHFQLNDLVDAFYRDGWWTGVITTVVDSSNFVVAFQNPPDQIQFNSSDLRVHRRWDGGRWVQPEIQRTAGLMFTVGKKVEVCFEGENLRDVWFPATVVENSGNNSFLVEYQQPGIGDEATVHKVTVDYLHIRPSPPHLRDKNFVLLEKVDAYSDFGWWSGVVTKELAGNRYNVFFKHTKKEREFDCSRVRPHMDWKGGKWFTTSQRSKRGKGVELKTPTTDSSRKKGRLETELIAEGAKEDPVPVKTSSQENVEKDVTKDLTECNGNGMTVSEEKKLEVLNVAEGERKEASPCVGLAPLTVVDKKKSVSSSVDGSVTEGKEGEAETVAPTPTPKRKRGRPPKLQATSLETPVAAAVAVAVNDEIEKEGVGVGPPEMESGQRSASSVTKPLEKLPAEDNNDVQNLENTSSNNKQQLPNENVQVQPQPQPQLQEGKKYSSMKGKRGKRRTISINSESPPTEDCREKKADKVKDDILNSPTPTRNVEAASVGKSVSDDQPLSRWLVQSPSVDGHGTEGTGSVEQPRERERDMESEMMIVTSPAAAASGLGFCDGLPFMISSPTLWKTIESMDALRKIPQKPHFRPLEGMKESGREGLAIGSMVTFSTVVDRTCALRFEDPRSAIEECLETLAELEPHGFQVDLIRDRLTQLLLIKDKQEDLQQQLLSQQNLEEAHMEQIKLDAEIDEIDTEITQLEERRRQLLSTKEKHDSHMALTKAAGDRLHQQLGVVGTEFHLLAAASFF
ncbi:DUF724 domain-containing protein 7 isoform X3 [Lactuca sativa]|uniref:DUF724 domain-containing protein 7 isoform X3 n=1 Tax=Lactuca sativa TaxID=4236 RepID=UPI000CD85DE4|nr:DUF724 domain-containing protein 7 isoform X3 [Lactuca sativa]